MKVAHFVRSRWIGRGILNTSEHFIARFGDAALSIFLITNLPIETFSRLVWAQAWIAPLLIFWICPENIIYRDYAKWLESGVEYLRRRILILRWICWSKLILACVLSFLGIWSGKAGAVLSLFWAFAILLAPHLAGADREFLRVHLELRRLTWITVFQKIGIIFATAGVAWVWPGKLELLAGAALVIALVTSVLAAYWVDKSFTEMKSGRSNSRPDPQSAWQIIYENISSFSLWSHPQGVIYGWVQTMDLYFLSFIPGVDRMLGLYGVIVKLSNFLLAIPAAVGNVFIMWLGQRTEKSDGGIERERSEVARFSLLIGVGSLIQAAIFYGLGAWCLTLLSRGRWSLEEMVTMHSWWNWKMIALIGWAASLPLFSWLAVRGWIKESLIFVLVPWAIVSAGLNYWASEFGPLGVAKISVVVGALLLVAIWVLFCKRKTQKLERVVDVEMIT